MPTTKATDEVRDGARLIARLIEPLTGQVYFAPECHERYQALGFNGSPYTTGTGWPCPTGRPTSRAAARRSARRPGSWSRPPSACSTPEAVVPAVTFGWTLTDAATIAAARLEGAVAPARADPRTVARGHRPGQRDPRPSRRSAGAMGPGALRGHPRPGAARHTARRPVPPRRPAPRVPRRQPHRRLGGRPATTPPRSACSPSSTGGCRPAPTCAPRLDRRPARRRRSPPHRSRPHGGRRADRRRPRRTAKRSRTRRTPRWHPPSSAIGERPARSSRHLLKPWALAVMEAGGYPSPPCAHHRARGARPESDSGSSHQGHTGGRSAGTWSVNCGRALLEERHDAFADVAPSGRASDRRRVDPVRGHRVRLPEHPPQHLAGHGHRHRGGGRRDLGGQLVGGGEQVVGGVDRSDQPAVERLLRIEHPTRDRPLERGVDARRPAGGTRRSTPRAPDRAGRTRTRSGRSRWPGGCPSAGSWWHPPRRPAR